MTQTVAPTYINWNYTYRCNFRCTHCYSRSPGYPTELGEADYERIAAEIVRMNIFAVGFGGGEPLFRSDIFRTIETLSTAGVDTHLTTNGSLLDNATAQRLSKIECGKVLVSIDSVDAGQNDRFRAKPGSFDMSIKALRACVDAGLETHVSWVVNKTNLTQLPDLIQLAESLKLNGISLKLFRAAGFGLINKDLYELSADEVRMAYRTVRKLQKATDLDVAFFQTGTDSACSCGITQLTLRPNGDVAICPYDDEIIGTLRERPLAEIWEHSPALARRRLNVSDCLGDGEKPWPSNPSLRTAHATAS